MGSRTDDLDRFLKTDGIRILRDSGFFRAKPAVPLTVQELAALDPRRLDRQSLGDLLDRAEDLLDAVEDSEPKNRRGKAHAVWEEQFWQTAKSVRSLRESLSGLPE